MSISSSLNAGVAGLSANATRLATISDNIANSATYGYRRVETDFQSMVTGAKGGKYSAGGVQASSRRLIDTGGSLIPTTNPTDLAVRGRGFLPVASANAIKAGNQNPQLMMATTGSFRPDKDGYLVSEAGLALMGWPANTDGTFPNVPRDSNNALEPIRLLTTELAGSPTTAVALGVNLPSTSTVAGAAGDVEVLSIEYYGNLGQPETLNITFTPTVPATGSSNEWRMEIRDSASGNAVIGDYTMTFEDARTDAGTLQAVVTNSGGAYDPVTGKAMLNVGGGPMEIDLGILGETGGMSQLGDAYAPLKVGKDGAPVGTMTDINVDGNGIVTANYNTGITRTIFRIPLVDVPNPNELGISLDFQTYVPSSASGPYFMWDAGTGPSGEILAFMREESATDVASELTDMIKTQRAYSTNAKVIQTVDEMLQETTNIKR
ncbi:flagellar hook-basal body complex protein [Shimia sp. R11_0]|uniref:flagellar hook protein FlgE n=1 Tax=Shimia sp. R11_0 TaxID=2821096 RepID=UPI001ADBF01B|nr:flagellar hook-basal body complex protein [Shimia sp. R11_0]MBO9475956.1 flagellar hook-basal body complex protein [Shimia sp. R11_0]